MKITKTNTSSIYTNDTVSASTFSIKNIYARLFFPETSGSFLVIGKKFDAKEQMLSFMKKNKEAFDELAKM